MWSGKKQLFPASIPSGRSGLRGPVLLRKCARGPLEAPRFVLLIGVLAGLTFCSGCKSHPDQKASVERQGADLTPLRLRSVSPPPSTVVVAAEGATSALPVVALLSERPGDCERLGRAYAQRAHLLCSGVGRTPQEPPDGGRDPAGPASLEEAMHRALSFLKTNYPRYVAPSPVHLFAAAPYAQVGLRMMLREPGVFAYTYIAGLQPDALRAPTVLALQEGGARILLLDMEIPLRTQFLAQAAQRRGFWIAAVGDAELGWTRAIRTFQKADPRLLGDAVRLPSTGRRPR